VLFLCLSVAINRVVLYYTNTVIRVRIPLVAASFSVPSCDGILQWSDPSYKATRALSYTTHFHLSPQLRMRGAIPPLSRAFSWCGAWWGIRTTLPFTYWWSELLFVDSIVQALVNTVKNLQLRLGFQRRPCSMYLVQRRPWLKSDSSTKKKFNIYFVWVNVLWLFNVYFNCMAKKRIWRYH
jgi:hypothetical protein